MSVLVLGILEPGRTGRMQLLLLRCDCGRVYRQRVSHPQVARRKHCMMCRPDRPTWRYACGECGERGHNSATCPRMPAEERGR